MGRFDVRNIRYNQLSAGFPAKKTTLGSLTLEEPCYGTSAAAVERTDEKQPKYIRITDFDDWGIEEDHHYMTAASYSQKHLLKTNDILFARTGGTVGKTYFYDGEADEAVFAGYCIRFRFNEDKVVSKFVYWYTKTVLYKDWVTGIQRPSGQPNINKEEYKSFEIILPDIDCQRKMAAKLDHALNKRNLDLRNAEALLEKFETKIVRTFKLQNDVQAKLCFAIHLKDIDGVIDAKRYAFLNKNAGKLTIGDICEIVKEKVPVSRFAGQVIDWIRIDDLSSRPLDIDGVRTQAADEVEGSFFEVQKGDILVARLGPTILNQKIVMVRALERTTIASAEFLVLRCKKEYDPEMVMAVLRTAYYRNLMYSYARGSTPSRYRLNREDMLKLPFPDIRGYQKEFASEACELRKKVKNIRAQAERDWEKAKEQFERDLLRE